MVAFLLHVSQTIFRTRKTRYMLDLLILIIERLSYSKEYREWRKERYKYKAKK